MALKRDSVSDEALMGRYQSGDRASFAILVGRHKTAIFNFILRQIRLAPVAEDLTQEVFVRVVTGASEFRHSSRFSTWIYTIARNLCIDQIRKDRLRRHPSLEQPTGPDTDGPSLGDRIADTHPTREVDRAAIGGELSQHILQALDELPEDQREVFLLREHANIPFKDIAQMLGVPENTVKSRMRYALERLQKALSEYEDYARTLK